MQTDRVTGVLSGWSVLLIVWLSAGMYAFVWLDRGWVPHDEGQFGQAAERVLSGEMPHRDFDEMYTGGLTHLNAVAFRVLGQTLFSLRLALFGFFLLWVPAVYYVASRFVSPLVAGGVTLLAAVWSIPNYSAPVPSWYNLFFAVFGIAAVMRYLETGRRRWLFAAGLCGGLSFLVKLVGVYYVAGVLLFLIFREQSLLREPDRVAAPRGRSYSLFVSAGLAVFTAIVVRVYHRDWSFSELVLFTVPNATVALTLLWREAQHPPGRSRARFASLFAMCGPFLAGVAAPVGLYLLPFAIGHGLASFYQGVFVLPGRRLTYAAYPTPQFEWLLVLPILTLLCGILQTKRPRAGVVAVVLVGTLLAFVLVASAASMPIYLLAWRPTVFIVPLAIVAAVFTLRLGSLVTDLRQQKVMLLLSVTAVCGLVQFPFPAPIYFCFLAPLVALSLAAVLSARPRAGQSLALLLLVFYLAFAVMRVAPGFIYAMGRYYEPDRLTARLTLPRAAGLRVHPVEAQVYERLIAVVAERAKGSFIYAFPDCPEVYFLSGFRNPTRTVYDFLADPTTPDRVLSVLEERDVNAVVINAKPYFSGAPSSTLVAELQTRFPHVEAVGHFEVRWRE